MGDTRQKSKQMSVVPCVVSAAMRGMSAWDNANGVTSAIPPNVRTAPTVMNPAPKRKRNKNDNQ